MRLRVPCGTYVLVDQESCGSASYEAELVVHVVAGWRTEVYLDCQDRREASLAGDANEACSVREIDFSSAAAFLVKCGSSTPLMRPEGRATELSRLILTSGRPATPPAKSIVEVAPLAAIFSAYANAIASSLAKPLKVARVRQCLEHLPPAIRQSHPDVVLLDAWLRSQDKPKKRTSKATATTARDASTDRGLPPWLAPSVSAGWRLLDELAVAPPRQRTAVVAIGQWRLAGSVWTQTRIPASKASSLRSQLASAFVNESLVPAVVSSSSTLDPPWTDDAWSPALPGLRKPNSDHSPFQQALRRRIIDGIEAGDANPQSVFTLAATFGLDATLAAAAYQEVFEQARGWVGR